MTSNDTTARRGADHLVDGLKTLGLDTIYSLSGNQIMPVYDALIGSGMRLIHTRHEAAAVHMAEADAQLTNRVGVALLTAGPGFANGLSAMWDASQSQTPVLVMTGDSPVARDGHGAFQEMDQQTAAGAVTKHSFRVEQATDLYDAVCDASRMALEGTPGPVHLSLPDDVLRKTVDRAASAERPPLNTAGDALGPSSDIAMTIKAARRPLIFVGPSLARAHWKRSLQAYARSCHIPIIALESPRGMRAPRIGALAEILPQSDLIVTLGLTPNFLLGFGEAPAINDDAHFICIHDDEAELARAASRLGEKRVDTLAMSAFGALCALSNNGETMAALRSDKTESDWCDKVDAAVAYRPEAWTTIKADAPPFHAAAVAHAIKPFLADNPETTLTIDGGEVGQWAQAILDAEFALINGPSGAIGASIPYAIAARTARPDAPSLAILGDGTAGFHFMEFETAIRENLCFVAIIGNDAKWNAEYQIQVRDYGENRTFGCEMAETRYDEIVRAMGGYGEQVTDLSELRPAIERALASGLPACINVPLASNAAPLIRRA